MQQVAQTHPARQGLRLERRIFMEYAVLLYVIIVIALGILGYRKNADVSELNIGQGNISWISTSFSVAATWIWAPALFVASQRAYIDGILGLFWFFVPNILCLIFFAFLAEKSRKYGTVETISGLMEKLYNSKRVFWVYNTELAILAICSTAVQLLAGGIALSYITGYPFLTITILLALVALTYSLMGGIRASISTDVVQMILMIVAVVVALIYLLPVNDIAFNGIKNRSMNFISMDNINIFFAYGLTTTIGLLSGPIGDQTFWQRAFAVNPRNIRKMFIASAFIFGVIPLGMGIIGGMATSGGFVAKDTSIVGLEFIIAKTSIVIQILFVLCIVSGLSSTIDSNLCAISSLVTNMHKKLHTVFWGRVSMCLLTILGIAIANIPGISIFYLFLFYGVLRSTVAIPTALTMIKGPVFSESGIFYGIVSALCIGIPIYLIGALLNISFMTISGTILAVLLPLAFMRKVGANAKLSGQKVR
jgi:Na+/proline symporter